ncbi:MAG: hypothetical protein R2731_18015 [Nocardioides sp.]
MTMHSSQPGFRLVRRGYEPTEVDQHVAELAAAAATHQQQVAELAARVRELEAAQAFAGEQVEPAPAPTFADFGARVGQILSLAEEEAAEIRASAKTDFEARLHEAETAAEKVRVQADEYSRDRRSKVDAESKTIVGNAHRRADELMEEADRDSAARRAEADAIYESQQAKAAQAAADFETTLADRREKAESEFQAQFGTARAQLEEAQAHLEQTRAESQRIRGEADLSARRVMEDAQKEADQIVSQARAHADRIRAESDRELVAATQRRDSINAQLTNVRQMLATLTNVAPAGLAGLDLAPAEPPVEAAGPVADEPAEEVAAEAEAVLETGDETVDTDVAEADGAAEQPAE